MYKTNHSKEMESVFRAIGRYLRNGYLLVFQAPSEATTTSWHELQVLVKNTSEPLKVTSNGWLYHPFASGPRLAEVEMLGPVPSYGKLVVIGAETLPALSVQWPLTDADAVSGPE